MDGGSERRREGEREWVRTNKRKKLLFEKQKQCNCIGMFNATALECSMQLHWNVLCNCIGTFNAIS